jgi:hypothetical protein
VGAVGGLGFGLVAFNAMEFMGVALARLSRMVASGECGRTAPCEASVVEAVVVCGNGSLTHLPAPPRRVSPLTLLLMIIAIAIAASPTSCGRYP